MTQRNKKPQSTAKE